MASEYPFDEKNLSFSDDDASSLFITQSTFSNVNTQQVSNAVDFFDNFGGDMSCGDASEVASNDLKNLEVPEDW